MSSPSVWARPARSPLCSTERQRGIGVSVIELAACTSVVISGGLTMKESDGSLAEGAAISFTISTFVALMWIVLKLSLLIWNVSFELLCLPASILFFIVVLTGSVISSVHEDFRPLGIATLFGWVDVLAFGLGVVWAAHQWWQDGCQEYLKSIRGICAIIEMTLDSSIITCTCVGLDQADWFDIKDDHYTGVQLLLACAALGVFWRMTSFFACFVSREYTKSVSILLLDVFMCCSWIAFYVAAWLYAILNSPSRPMLAAASLAAICAASLCLHLFAVGVELKKHYVGERCCWKMNKVGPASDSSETLADAQAVQFVEMNLRGLRPSIVKAMESTDSRWEWRGELGRGRMGSVFLLRHRESGELIADKQLRPRDGMERDCLFKETRVLSHIRGWKHPHLVDYVASWDNTGTLHLFMEYCEQHSLEIAFNDAIRDKEVFKESQITNVLLHIASGLLFMHQRNVIHRNLKPSNVLIGPNQLLKLSDIGFAGSSYTSVYNSPEVQTEMDFSDSSDIWSLGVIILRMITLESIPELVKLTKSLPVQLRPDLDPEFSKLITCMLDKTPANRPTIATVILLNMNKVYSFS